VYSERNLGVGAAFRRHGEGAVAVVFVPGFLDDQRVWDRVIALSRAAGVEFVQLDLAGCGERRNEQGPFDLGRFVADVVSVIDALAKPVVLVGQSMGAPIAELAAASAGERVVGLVLVTPVPLAGMRLPPDAVAAFSSLASDVRAQREVRRQPSVSLPAADLERLATSGARIRPEVVGALVDCWNNGSADARATSAYDGPVLMLRGAGDPLITREIFAEGVQPRFPSAHSVIVDHAGHWPHLEQSAAVAAHLDTFLTSVCRPSASPTTTGMIDMSHDSGTQPNTTAEVDPQGWTQAFAAQSADAFGDAFAEDVVLDSTTLYRPVKGRDLVKQTMAAASEIYESLVFTRQAVNGPRTYLEWEATALGGLALHGITILAKDEDGKITHLAIHHRPLGAELKFSAEIGRRLEDVLDPSYFYQGD
jgi:pimeloyl-ACP methyl ester carboxylesterase